MCVGACAGCVDALRRCVCLCVCLLVRMLVRLRACACVCLCLSLRVHALSARVCVPVPLPMPVCDDVCADVFVYTGAKTTTYWIFTRKTSSAYNEIDFARATHYHLSSGSQILSTIINAHDFVRATHFISTFDCQLKRSRDFLRALHRHIFIRNLNFQLNTQLCWELQFVSLKSQC